MSRSDNIEIVITGIGLVSPIGIGSRAVWDSIENNRCGIRPVETIDASEPPVRFAAEVPDFSPRKYIQPRKNIKLMCRDAQLGVVASMLACEEAGLTAESVDHERFGVVMGADHISGPFEDTEASFLPCVENHVFTFAKWGESMFNANPLGFLKTLPNMTGAHVSITQDARGLE